MNMLQSRNTFRTPLSSTDVNDVVIYSDNLLKYDVLIDISINFSVFQNIF